MLDRDNSFVPVREGSILEQGTTRAYHTVELYGFSYITKSSRYWPGVKLRFHIEIRLDIPALNPELGDKSLKEVIMMEGCLARRNKHGELSWTPPQARNGNFYANIIWVSGDFYERVRAALASSKFVEKLDYVQATQNVPAQEIDSDLPSRLEA